MQGLKEAQSSSNESQSSSNFKENVHSKTGDTESHPLLGSKEVPVEQTFAWMLFHWGGFFVGGSTFVAGTALYFFPDIPFGGQWSALLYTIGSLGFLTVDVMEFFTFTEDLLIRINIVLSMIGSTLYVIGSIGFFSQIYEITDEVGIWGFILGSFFIGSSQLWKTFRIGSSSSSKDGTFSIVQLLSDTSKMTEIGVELNAGVGAWCFFVGTVMYRIGPLEGPFYTSILLIWLAGSFFFLAGALYLGYRHWVMRV